MELLRQASDFLEVSDTKCPKCLGPRMAGRESCGTCGLVFARLDVNALRPSTELMTRWNTVCDEWTSMDRHHALRHRAMTGATDQAQPLSRMYRVHLLKNPAEPIATQALNIMSKAAAAQVMSAQIKSDSDKAKRGDGPTFARKMFRLLRLFGIPVP